MLHSIRHDSIISLINKSIDRVNENSLGFLNFNNNITCISSLLLMIYHTTTLNETFTKEQENNIISLFNLIK